MRFRVFEFFAQAVSRKPFWEAFGTHFWSKNDPRSRLGALLGNLWGPVGPSWWYLGALLGTRGPQRHPKRAPRRSEESFLGRFGSLLEAFLAPFLEHFSNLVFGSLLVRMLVHFGAALGPNGSPKTAKNAER